MLDDIRKIVIFGGCITFIAADSLGIELTDSIPGQHLEEVVVTGNSARQRIDNPPWR